MPILAREPDQYPDNLLDEPLQSNWWAIYTMSRREKELMRKLHAKQIAFYGPTIEQRKRSPAGRIRTSYMPVFNGYVFLNGGPNERYEAMTTNCVSRAVEVKDVETFVEELRAINRVLTSGFDVSREERLESGDAVRVISGPLKGAQGTLLYRKGCKRLCVSVNFVQQGVSVEVDECDIRAI